MLLQGSLPWVAMPEEVKQNQWEWLDWIVSLDGVISQVRKTITWIDLLHEEYKSSETMWERFWYLHRVDEEKKAESEFTYKIMPPHAILNELEEIYIKMAVHNRRRGFLQRNIIAWNGWVARLQAPLPTWIDWPDVLKQMLHAGLIRLASDSEKGPPVRRKGSTREGLLRIWRTMTMMKTRGLSNSEKQARHCCVLAPATLSTRKKSHRPCQRRTGAKIRLMKVTVDNANTILDVLLPFNVVSLPPPLPFP